MSATSHKMNPGPSTLRVLSQLTICYPHLQLSRQGDPSVRTTRFTRAYRAREESQDGPAECDEIGVAALPESTTFKTPRTLVTSE